MMLAKACDKINKKCFQRGKWMKWIKNIFYILFLLSLNGAVLYASADESGVRRTKTLYPLPSVIVMNAYRYLGTLQKFSIDAVTSNDDYFKGAMVATFTHHVHIDLQRPSRLYIEVNGDLKNRSFYLDNGDFTVLDENLEYYGKLKVPKMIDAALDYLFEQYNIKTALANILYLDLYKRIPPQNEGYYFGDSRVDGVVCHHIGFSNALQETQFWIEKGERPLIHKFIVIDKTEVHLLRSGTMLRWNLEPEFSDNLFDFIPSAGMMEIPIEADTKKEE